MRPDGFDFGAASNGGEAVADALYFAVLPDREASRRLADLGDGLLKRRRLNAARMAAARLHVSLWGVSRGRRLDNETVAAAKAIGAGVSWPDFEVVFTKAATFGGGALVFLCAEGANWALIGLRDAIHAAREDLGIDGGRPRAFAPHLTFARSRERMGEVFLDEPVRWPARELVLVHSEQGRSRHTHLARWPLRGGEIA